jgi:uncharacterized protein
MDAEVFTIPGLYSSGPQHWQTLWETQYGFTRIVQKDWDTPRCEDWLGRIEEALRDRSLEKVVLVAHSLGCCTVVKWAQKYNHKIKAALLVAPSDVEAPSYPPGSRGFDPMPLYRLDFPSILISSTNDPYVSMERAKFFAQSWGAQFVDIGAWGHLNSSSGLGIWPQGFGWLEKLL